MFCCWNGCVRRVYRVATARATHDTERVVRVAVYEAHPLEGRNRCQFDWKDDDLHRFRGEAYEDVFYGRGLNLHDFAQRFYRHRLHARDGDDDARSMWICWIVRELAVHGEIDGRHVLVHFRDVVTDHAHVE